jgi:endonuclease VIII
MAEGDSILRLAGRLDEALVGEALSVRTPGPRRPAGLPAATLDGRVLEHTESRGKHLILHFEGELALHSHLGMRGSWHIYGDRERWRRPARQAWIALAGDSAEAVNFGGSSMRIAREAQLRRDPRLARLGPELLAEDFDPKAASARIRSEGPSAELGEVLLDQGLVAGIGNIFKSEGCFEVGLDPGRRLETVGDEQLSVLLGSTRGLMLEAAESGRQPSRVYRRAGRPCPRCRTTIRSRAQGDSARTTYWCPGCQPPGR